MLRPLLKYAHEDPKVTALADAARTEPQRAFVSASLRPYLLASLLDAEPERPALVVAGDDRAARDLAADLRAFLSPRPVRFYPARGMRYESHLAPPPHLVGLRIAALDLVRCELFDIEVERLTWFSTFTQRSLEEAERVEIAPAAELGPEHRELAEMAATSEADERPDIADVLPVDRFLELLDLVPDDAMVTVAAEEELAPALKDLWEDVTASFHDQDAHHLYVHPDRLAETLDRRAALRLSSISGDQPHEFRAQSADTAARSLKDAEPELEKLVRSGYRTVVAWARRGEAERAAYNLARLRVE